MISLIENELMNLASLGMQESGLHWTRLSLALTSNPITPALPPESPQLTIQIHWLIPSGKGMENLRVIGYTFALKDEASIPESQEDLALSN